MYVCMYVCMWYSLRVCDEYGVGSVSEREVMGERERSRSGHDRYLISGCGLACYTTVL